MSVQTRSESLDEPLVKHKINANNMSINKSQSNSATNSKLVVYAIGIFFSYLYFGVLQERITRSKYGDRNETFKCTVSLVFVQCVVNAIFAKIMLMTFMRQGLDSTNKWYYCFSSSSYLAAMVSSNMALQHVNYPTQVIGKSCKPIPVMILGVLLGRKRYPLSKYLFVLMIVVGVGIFMYKDNKSSSASSMALGAGELLLILSLTMDGMTGAFQERMKNEYKTQSGHMMLQMNLWSTLILGLILLISGEVWRFIEFVGRYPFVISNIMQFSVLSAIGQMFIFLTVANFGPLPCSIITTTRKFFTVLFSVIFFGNALSDRQWLGTGLVFVGLALDSFYGKKSQKTKADK